MSENLEKLRTAFPGLAWVASPNNSYAGAASAFDPMAEPPQQWVIFVDADLSAWQLVGRHASPRLRLNRSNKTGRAPLSTLGRVIAAEAKRILAEAAALEVTGRMLQRAATGPQEWAALVLDKEYGVFVAHTRLGAIDLAVEGLLEDVSLGREEPDAFDVEIHEDPTWCEKAPQFCDEHDHDKHARFLENQAGVTISVEVYYTDPGDEDSELDWREVTE